MTTGTREDYLRAVYALTERHGKNVKSVQIAEFMGLAKSTVSERLKGLVSEGLIAQEPYGAVSFTSKGKKLAQDLTYKHRIIEVFLHDILKMNKREIHEEAHKLEHAFSDKVIKKLAVFLGKPKTDPHGKPLR